MGDIIRHHTAVVIGSGFGGCMTALPLADKFSQRGRGETIHMLERGTWWTTPITTVQDKEVATYDFLVQQQHQPVQFWPSRNDFIGFIDIFTRCFRSPRNIDGLYDMTSFGKRGLLGLFGSENDGVDIVRASGVGGGSLVYSNITIRPPNFVLEDARWPLTWSAEERDNYYDLARHAIGYGITSALSVRESKLPYHGTSLPPKFVNSGLSNIVSRTARLNPHCHVKADPNNSRGIKQIVISKSPNPPPPAPPVPDRNNSLWLDRARVFQTAVGQLTTDFGAVDLAINDITPDDVLLGSDQLPPNYPREKPLNYCERQGRCNLGCLPGARHTLNKQLMAAALGKPDGTPREFDNMTIEALAEVKVIRALPSGGYEIEYVQHAPQGSKNPVRKTQVKMTADIVIVAAGCLGTTEILLRSKQVGALPNLSDDLGQGFSTNGDYIAFLDKTAERIGLTRGPVTTSFAHFNTTEPGTGGQPGKFHTLEDQGTPPAFASIIGTGVPIIRSLASGRRGRLFIFLSIIRWGTRKVARIIKGFFSNYAVRGDLFRSEGEVASNMICVVGMGRDDSNGVFRLGSAGESPMRLSRADGKPFYSDSIYEEIRKSLDKLVPILDPKHPERSFVNPFLTNTAGAFDAKAIALSHPLGGCRMAKNASSGVVDEFGRVFDRTKTGERPFYEKLYVADASIIPTALGVNPSLTISTLALRVADNIIKEL